MSNIDVEVFFGAVDSLYFRGSRPHSAAGASALPSDFPPSVSTLSGTVRTRLGDALGIKWHELKESHGKVSSKSVQEFAGVDLAQLIGSSKDTGLLSFTEPRLYKKQQRLYPVPAVLLQTAEGEVVRMELGGIVNCDLGKVHLPQLPKGVVNAKPIENCWLNEAGLQLFLQGKTPKKEHFIQQGDVLGYESRLGIGRDLATATVKSGLLYQTEHLRMKDDVEFSIVFSLPEILVEPLLRNIKESPLQRFGGEGRMAYLRAEKCSYSLKFTAEITQPKLLMLLTDMLPDENFDALPIAGLKASQHEGADCWEGDVNGVALRLLSVVSGKAKRFGGWDIRHNKPREVQSYIPAGSCFYVEALAEANLNALNGSQIGRRTDFAYGTLMCAK